MGDELPVPGGIQPAGKVIKGSQALGRGRIQRTPESHEGWGGASSLEIPISAKRSPKKWGKLSSTLTPFRGIPGSPTLAAFSSDPQF